MSLFTAIFLIFLSFAGGYCLSGMLGAGTTEDLRREVSYLEEIQRNQRRIIELKDEQIAELEAENNAIYLVHKENSKV